MRKIVNLFYAINFTKALIFWIPISYFFYTEHIGLSLSQITILAGVFGLSNIIFEIPSGTLADRFGRKKTYLVGNSISIVAFLTFIIGDNFIWMAIAVALQGIGGAMCSGNLEALVHDYFHEKNIPESKYKEILSNQYSYFFSGRAFAFFFAGFMYNINHFLPFISTIFAYLVIVILIILLPKTNQCFENNRSTLQHIGESLTDLKNNSGLLFVIASLGIFCGIGHIYRQTYQPFLEKIGYNIGSIGIIFAVLSLFSATGSYILQKLRIKFKEEKIIIIMFVLNIFIGILFLSFNKIFGIIGILLLSITFGFVMSLGNGYISNHSRKTNKSTMLSLLGFSISIFGAFTSFILGYILSFTNLENLYLGSTLISILVLFLILKAKKASF